MKARPKKTPPFQSATLIAGALLLLIVFVSAGYILTTQPTADVTIDPSAKALSLAHRKWRNRQPLAYTHTVDRDCDCPTAFRETYFVAVDAAATRFSLKQNVGQTPPDPRSIDDLFELLDKAFQQNAAVSVTYDPDFGYPDNLRIDWSPERFDDEESYYIREFQPVE